MEFDEFLTNDSLKVSESEALNKNVLVFAFVGDAVFTLFVRELLAIHSTKKAGVLHTETSKFVKASFQAHLLDLLESDLLNEKEIRLCKSARNIKTHNVAKNSNLEEYKKATSFESLIGYLYMTKQNDRLKQILDFCEVNIKQENDNK